MSWQAKWETTIEEDQAYCLQDIFDVHLPLIYGEGIDHAFRRLRKEFAGYSLRAVTLLSQNWRQNCA